MAKVGLWLTGIGFLIVLVGLGNASAIANELSVEEAVRLGNSLVTPLCVWDGTCNPAEYDPSSKQAAQGLWYGLSALGGVMAIVGVVMGVMSPRPSGTIPDEGGDATQEVAPTTAPNYCVQCGEKVNGAFCSRCGYKHLQ